MAPAVIHTNCIVEVFILSERGIPIISKTYRRSEAVPGIADVFFEVLRSRSCAPCFRHEGINFVWVLKPGGLILFTYNRTNLAPSYIIEFLHNLTTLIADYIGLPCHSAKPFSVIHGLRLGF